MKDVSVFHMYYIVLIHYPKSTGFISLMEDFVYQYKCSRAVTVCDIYLF
jgi:hypothetical protein